MSWLKHRFEESDIKEAWVFDWYYCLWCGVNHANCFHHIISPQSGRYKKGEFNKSIFNSCPLSNFICHLYNPELHKIETEKMFLRKVARKIFKAKYVLKEYDEMFLYIYKDLYLDKEDVSP